MTSPVEKAEPVIVEVPFTEESTEATIEETKIPSTFAVNLKQEEIEKACTDGIEQLIAKESYFIQGEYFTIYPQRENDGYRSWKLSRRYGNDALDLIYEDMQMDRCIVGSSVLLGDMYGMYYGDFWVNEGSRTEWNTGDVHSWLDRYSPEGEEVFFPEGTGVISDDSVSFRMAWCDF